MKEKLIRFMQGRYGIDQLSKFLLITGLAVVLLSAFFGETAVSMLLYIFGWGVVIYCYFRIFSRNVQKRYAENQAYLMKTYDFYKEKLSCADNENIELKSKKSP